MEIADERRTGCQALTFLPERRRACRCVPMVSGLLVRVAKLENDWLRPGAAINRHSRRQCIASREAHWYVYSRKPCRR